MKCPYCEKDRKINSKKKMILTCGDKECIGKHMSKVKQGTSKRSRWNKEFV